MLFFSLFLSSPTLAGEGCSDPYAIVASWRVQTSELRLDRGILTLDGAFVANDVLEPPAVVGERIAFIVQRSDSHLTDLFVWDVTQDKAPWIALTGEDPRQAALSADGQAVAYVSGRTSIGSIYVLPFEGGEPRQLTNEGLVRIPGQAPKGFVEPPSTGLRFEGEQIVWEGRTETQAVRWTGGAE